MKLLVFEPYIYRKYEAFCPRQARLIPDSTNPEVLAVNSALFPA